MRNEQEHTCKSLKVCRVDCSAGGYHKPIILHAYTRFRCFSNVVTGVVMHHFYCHKLRTRLYPGYCQPFMDEDSNFRRCHDCRSNLLALFLK